MKALAINGSPRPGGNTAILLRHVCRELENEGIATEMFQLGGRKVAGCIACYKCFEAKNKRCAVYRRCGQRLHCQKWTRPM